MERKINKLEHSHVEVLCTVDGEQWKKAQQKAFEKEAAKIEIKGFRKGKAPVNLVKDRINPEKVFNDAIDMILPEIYRAIMLEDGIQPYAQPKVDVTKLSEEELEVKFTIVTAPTVELGEYKNLKVGKSEPTVTEEELQKEIDNMLDKNALLVVKEDASKEGDTVVMDFVGKVDGEAFEGGSAENYELVLGSHTFIPGFEEQLMGHKAGEHVEVNVTFPEQYSENLAGKPAVFECDIHEVKEKKLPDLDEEFVKEQNIKGVETVEQFRDHVKNKKLEEAKRNARGEYLNKLLEEIAKNSKFDVPEEVIDNQVNHRKDDFIKRMGQSQLSLEQYLQIIGQTEEQFLAQLKETSIKELNNYLILEEVAKKEGFDDISEEEVEFEISKLADQYGMTIDQVRNAIQNQIDEFKNNIKMTRVENFLFENND